MLQQKQLSMLSHIFATLQIELSHSQKALITEIPVSQCVATQQMEVMAGLAWSISTLGNLKLTAHSMHISHHKKTRTNYDACILFHVDDKDQV